MTPWVRYVVAIVIGLMAGVGIAVCGVRAGAMGSSDAIGPWTTGTDFGSGSQGAKTRAVVALRGLLALPAREARYFTAATDDDGRPLDGRCRYTLSGTGMPARWWSLTLYDRDGYLAGKGPYSVLSTRILTDASGNWTVNVAPRPAAGSWLPTAGLERFELTLRTYLPADEGRGNPDRAQLPSIRREGCA